MTLDSKEDGQTLPSPSDSGVVLSSGDATPSSQKSLSASVSETVMMNGPDAVLPADSFVTTKRDGTVKLHMTDTGPCSEKPISIPSALQETAKKYPNQVALATKRGDATQWTQWTYSQYLADVRRTAKALIKLGVEPYKGVGVIGFNSPEWFISHVGAIYSGAFAVGIYTTNTPEACFYVLDNAECAVCIAENDTQLQKILKVWDKLPNLKAVVQYSGQLKEKKENMYTWKEFLDLGNDVADTSLEERLKNQAPNKCCALIYTSGTTGNPKGAMISHDNMVWTAKMCLQVVRMKPQEVITVTYLPLSHIAAQMLDIIAPICNGGSVYFAKPDALKGSLGETLKEVRPTVFLGVPRVWEKMQEAVTAAGRSAGTLTKKFASWAKGVGYRGNISKAKGEGLPWGWSLANVVFKKVRRNTGLDRAKFCITAAAPITKDTLDFFLSLDVPLLEIYGMSESTGPHTISTPWCYRPTSVGQEFPGAQTKLDNPDQDGNGEICMFGRHVFMGYLNMEEKTKEALDEEGWLHSGDVGKKDADGFMYITGRIKELLITSGGENVAPVPIEDTVKEELPVVANCMLIGDKRKFLSMLITLKTEPDGDNVSDRLTAPAKEWCKSIGSQATTVSQILDSKDSAVLKAIQAGIDKANKKAVSNAQKIQKWSILPRDFSIPGGELGPTLKLRRPVVTKMYQKTIEAFYEEAAK